MLFVFHVMHGFGYAVLLVSAVGIIYCEWNRNHDEPSHDERVAKSDK